MDTTLILAAASCCGCSTPKDQQARRMPWPARRFDARAPCLAADRPGGHAAPLGIVPIFWTRVHLERGRRTIALKRRRSTASRLPHRPENAVFRFLAPKSIKPPFARYSHGVEVPAGKRLVLCSGQLGIGAGRSGAGRCRRAGRALLRQHRGDPRRGRAGTDGHRPHQRLCHRPRASAGPTWTCATGCLPTRRRPRR